MTRNYCLKALLVAALLSSLAPFAQAQAFPSRPIKIGMPFPAGQRPDVVFSDEWSWSPNSRNFNLQDTEADTYLQTASEKAYLEDVDALEWIMQAVRGDVVTQFDLNFAPDKPGLMMRQALYRLAAAEVGVQH